MSAETPHFYEFENFRLDPKEKILFRDDQPVPLTPKVFETLQIFVEHAGRLLEKDDLMRKIWEDRFVEESNLTFNIKMLRRTLNDDAHQPRFIETVPRRGYRFIAPVNQHVNGSTLGVDTIELARKPTTDRVRGFYVLIASLLVLIGAISIAFWLSRSAMNASTLSVPLLSKPFRSENV
ncbi:MAG TPA: transcriptional regulator, partial [Pyrinomonadaceae bacterium]|nr:transcriptional regulator [Pyrinomonadaceae bacterium]